MNEKKLCIITFGLLFGCITFCAGCTTKPAIINNEGFGYAKATSDELTEILERSAERVNNQLEQVEGITDTINRIDANLQLYFGEVAKLRAEITGLRDRLEKSAQSGNHSRDNSSGDLYIENSGGDLPIKRDQIPLDN